MAVLKLHTNPYAMTEDDKRVLAAYIHETMERFEQFCWDCHLNGTATQDQLERILSECAVKLRRLRRRYQARTAKQS